MEVWICILKLQTVLFFFFLSVCCLTSVTFPSRLLNTARALSIMVVPDSHPDKRRQRMIYSRRKTKAPFQATPFHIIILQLAAFTLVGLSSCLLLLNAPMSLCSQVYPSTCLFQRRDRKEGCVKWEKNDSSACTCCQLNVSECLSLSFCSFLNFPFWKYPLMRMEVYFNITLVIEME